MNRDALQKLCKEDLIALVLAQADVIAKLKELHPGDPKVAVYPYAGMQYQEIELDG